MAQTVGAAAASLFFRQLYDKDSSTYTYLLADPDTKEALLIDPVIEQVNRDLSYIEEMGFSLKYAINTHCHADHITSTGEIKKRVGGVKSGISKASGATADIYYEVGDEISIGGHSLKVLPTPGHTNGCVSYYTTSNGGMVFTGDAVLIRGCGRTDFQEGDSKKLYQSVHSQVFSLPDNTQLYPAHDYKGRMVSSVGEEKQHNPRLSKSEEEFVEIMAKVNASLSYPKKLDVALPANLVCGVHEFTEQVLAKLST